ncbi:nuclear envelope integral membrane protein 2 isoform X2 [Eublepharis macularius]|uniref:Nuclear envelope integral membrane protein 2 isoform X2 n=1 Tax=Eublepharis macularius TaxID=481883 RepID=A0AA97IZD3_EUBMA|nr:nuclear envelope integral membrane protein 2 isoform X2 [Eublepharis macularius]
MRSRARRPHPAGLLLRLLLGSLAGLRAGAGGGELALAAGGHCRNVKATDAVRTSESACYCYIPNGAIHLKNIWSSIQCIIQNIRQSGVSNESIVSVDQYGERTCFRVQLENKMLYTMDVQQTMLDKKLFFLFVVGGLLFHFAHNLSRSVVFYYSAGVTFGVLATLVFLLLMLKRFIPKLSTFWILMSGCWFCTLYLFYNLKEDLKRLWYDYTRYLLGYVLIVGSVSFAVCYQHGPLAREQSMNLLMWMLQLAGLILIYFGIAIPEVAYAAIATILCSKILHYPLRVFCSVGRKAHRFFRAEKPEVRYLTEDEYREQGESETVRALEELRGFCRSPSFPSWIAVVKLQAPQKFANFVLGLPHVSPEETNAHEEQYGIGGALLEEQLFTSETELEPDRQTGPFQRDEEEEEEEIRPQNSLLIRSREFL